MTDLERLVFAKNALKSERVEMISGMFCKIAGVANPNVDMVMLAHGLINKPNERRTVLMMLNMATGDVE